MRHVLALAAALFGGLLFSGAAAAADGPAAARGGVVVELYTSQGCNSCPPADAFLGELAKRKDVIALTFNVDYWDYLGWADTLASPLFTERQRAYAAAMGEGRVYTPEMVVGGRLNVVGSYRDDVEAAIRKVRAKLGAGGLLVGLTREDGHVVVRLPAAPAQSEATVWLLLYEHMREVRIGRGENGGRALRYYNVVRQLSNLGLWRGEAKEIAYMVDDLAKGGRDGCAVIVQEGGHGPILGAAAMDLVEPPS